MTENKERKKKKDMFTDSQSCLSIDTSVVLKGTVQQRRAIYRAIAMVSIPEHLAIEKLIESLPKSDRCMETTHVSEAGR
jgi:hypothetical protein